MMHASAQSAWHLAAAVCLQREIVWGKPVRPVQGGAEAELTAFLISTDTLLSLALSLERVGWWWLHGVQRRTNNNKVPQLSAVDSRPEYTEY